MKKPINSINNAKEMSTYGIKEYVAVMIEFLKISPSYALADLIIKRKLNTNDQHKLIIKLYQKNKNTPLSNAGIKELITDFSRVLSTYALYGDITKISFDDWWKKTGLDLYGIEHRRPSVRKIAGITKNESIDIHFHRALDDYFIKHRPIEGNPHVLILGIPLGLPKRLLFKQITRYIDEANIPVISRSKKGKKPLAAKRLRYKPLMQILKLISFKALAPNKPQWQLAVALNLSPANSGEQDLHKFKATKNNVNHRYKLNVISSRMLTKGKLIAENAARDIFPSYTNISLPYFDYQEIAKRQNIKVLKGIKSK